MSSTSSLQKRTRDPSIIESNVSADSSVYRALKRRNIYSHSSTFGRSIKVSARSILPFYQCPNNKIYQFVFPDNDPCTPYYIDYAHNAHGGNMLAVGDEEGRITLLRTDKNNEVIFVDYHRSFYCHPQAVVDVKWSIDDSMLLSASNDRLIRLWDVEHKTALAEFSGHDDSVKSVNWHPTNEHLIITGSKDGSFKIWDTRVNQQPLKDPTDTTKIPVYTCIKTVKNAHDLKTKERVKATKKPKPLLIRSVTCAMFLNHKEEKVITSGSADGSIKLWDIRAGRTPRELESTVFVNGNGKRHGITDMKMDSSGTRLFSCCMDNSVYMHYLTDLKRPALKYTDSNYKVGTFATRLSLSPDDQFLLSGSFDKGTFAWEIDNPSAKPYVFEGHTDKVTGVCWNKASINQFATCSDDFTTRIWNFEM